MGLPARGWLVTGFISLSSAGALAADTKVSFPSCTTTPTEADRKAAQGAFAAGQGSFNEADYATAITYWRDAYRRDCTAHLLLLNLARAFELKGDRAEAVTALETYLQRKPDAADSDQIRRRIENLKAQIAPAPVPTPTPATVPVSTTPIPPPPPPAATDQGTRSVVPLVVAGGGVVLAAVGTALLFDGKSKENKAQDACNGARTGCTSDVEQQGNNAISEQKGGGLILGVGVAAVATGLIWYFVSSPSNHAPPPTAATPFNGRAKFSAAFTPTFVGAYLSQTF